MNALHLFKITTLTAAITICGVACRPPQAGHDAACKHEPAVHPHDASCTHDHDEHDHDEHEHDEHKHNEHATHEHEHEHEHAHGEQCTHEHEHADDGIATFEVPLASQKLLGLSFAKVQQRPVQGSVRFPGRFELMPAARRNYSVPLEGTIEIVVQPLQAVHAGEALFTLRTPAWIKMQGVSENLASEMKFVQTELEATQTRLARLQAAGARSAELELQITLKEAELKHLAQQYAISQRTQQALLSENITVADDLFTFHALAAGHIEQLSVENGSWVETGQEIVCVTQVDKLWFHADGIPAELHNVKNGQSGWVEPLRPNNSTPMHGQISMGLVTDDQSRRHSIYLQSAELPDWALAGRAGILSIVTDSNAPQGLAVPQEAIVMDGLQAVVFVRDTQQATRFFKLDITPGVSDGEWVAVEGLEAGLDVVVDGAYELKLVAGGHQQKAAGHFHADGVFHEGEH